MSFYFNLLMLAGKQAAFPQVAGTATTTSASRGTSWNVNLPSSISSGDLLLMLFSDENNASGPSTPSGWSVLAPRVAITSVGQTAFWKSASGSEGATVSVTTGNNTISAITYRVTGWQGAPTAGTNSTGSSANPDPPSVAPGWGAASTLWIALESAATTTTSAYPASFTGGVTVASTVNIVQTASAQRAVAAASLDPGTFTIGASANWISNTIAIQPA